MLKLFSLAGTFLKSMSWRTWFFIIVAGAMFFLWTRGNRFEGKYADQLQANRNLEWKLATAKAELDTIRGLGDYSKPDTVWPDALPPRIIYRDSVTFDTVPGYGPAPIPTISGYVSFDTTETFGPDFNLLSVRVSGQFWYPKEYAWKNRLLIVPSFMEAPERPAEQRGNNWTVGLASVYTSRQRLYGGASVGYKGLSLIGAKSLNGGDWLIGVSYPLLEF